MHPGVPSTFQRSKDGSCPRSLQELGSPNEFSDDPDSLTSSWHSGRPDMCKDERRAYLFREPVQIGVAPCLLNRINESHCENEKHTYRMY